MSDTTQASVSRWKHRLQGFLNDNRMIAMGIVFGDIGTSPLYAEKVTLEMTGVHNPTAALVVGIASLIIWSLIISVGIKYVTIALRADNQGEGGILALLSLIKKNSISISASGVVLAGIVGTAFIIGDGVITPPVSVLSALEGLKVVIPGMSTDLIVGLAAVILIALFCVQRQGTHAIGKYFGLVMLCWFGSIGLVGLGNSLAHPWVFAALLPATAAHMIAQHFFASFIIMGSVFLALTGGEALYADMGHVGKTAIRQVFLLFVLPCLVLNYLGQAAVIIANPGTIGTDAFNPFFMAVPHLLQGPMVVLATAATIIASQALITGTFSLTRQAIQMSLFPRMKVVQTSDHEYGQIYVPVVNWMLMLGTLGVVVLFRTSDHLAAAYGIAVSSTMLITSFLLYMVMVERWGWSKLTALAITVPLGAVDTVFVLSNFAKIFQGGWLPISIGLLITFVMVTWNRSIMTKRRVLNSMSVPLDDFIAHADDGKYFRAPDHLAVWPTVVTDGVPAMFVWHAQNNHVVHEKVCFLTIEWTRNPREHGDDHVKFQDLGHGFYRLILRCGFKQRADIPAAVRLKLGKWPANKLTYFVGNERVVRKEHSSQLSTFFGTETTANLYASMAVNKLVRLYWIASYHVFKVLNRNSAKVTDYFELPPGQVEEVALVTAV